MPDPHLFPGHVEVVRLLLNAGADVNLASNVGDTALIAASCQGHVGTVRLMLDACAGKNLADSHERPTNKRSCDIELSTSKGQGGLLQVLKASHAGTYRAMAA